MTAPLERARLVDFRVRVPPGLCPVIDVPETNSSQYDAILNTGEKYSDANTVEDLITAMDNNGVDHAVMHAENELGDTADALNQTVADIVSKHPDRFTGIGTVTLKDFSIPKALRQIDECVELGMIGLSIEPAFFGMHLNEKQLYPVYAKVMENNLLVALHTGINYTTNRSMAGENPMLLDELACDFPSLTLVASHGGWPWINEMVAVARKHPQLYIEFGGIAPKYVAAQGSGWEVMHRFMNSVLKDQILYGTDWPTMDHQRTIKEWQEMGLKPEVLSALLAENARSLIHRHSNDG
ncbi:amidohydrolase family protein [SAR92 clade bacterium H246]